MTVSPSQCWCFWCQLRQVHVHPTPDHIKSGLACAGSMYLQEEANLMWPKRGINVAVEFGSHVLERDARGLKSEADFPSHYEQAVVKSMAQPSMLTPGVPSLTPAHLLLCYIGYTYMLHRLCTVSQRRGHVEVNLHAAVFPNAWCKYTCAYIRATAIVISLEWPSRTMTSIWCRTKM